MKKKHIIIPLLVSFCFITINCFAQGDGARMILWGPNGVTGAIPKWMSLNQNITPANILVKDADVHINAFPITVIHNFGLAGRFAQVMVNAVPGNVTATLLNQTTDSQIPTYFCKCKWFCRWFYWV